MSQPPTVVGYLDRMSYRAGQSITVFGRADNAPVTIRLVRLGRGPIVGRDLPSAVQEIAWEAAGDYIVPTQSSCVGSFLTAVPGGQLTSAQGFAIGCFIWPTTADASDIQTIFQLTGAEGEEVRIELQDSAVTARILTKDAGEQTVACDVRIPNRAWALVEFFVTIDKATLTVKTTDLLYGSDANESIPGVQFTADEPRLTFAARNPSDVETFPGYARGRAQAHFNGKIAHPYVIHGKSAADLGRTSAPDDLVDFVARNGGALWTLSPNASSVDRFTCACVSGSGADAILVNLPNQGVTGPNWDRTSVSFRERPEQYSAAHFHSTDVADVGWTPIVQATLPADLPSAIYGVELAAADGTSDTTPLFVYSPPGAPKSRICFVGSAFTYLAYGNEDLISFFAEINGGILAQDSDLFNLARSRQVFQSRDFGASLYDTHTDGSGVHYSSARRPLLDMRPDYEFWGYEGGGGRGFTADLYLAEWLEMYGYEFDVTTDLELHNFGASALDGYDIVILGSHPEYHSGKELDAIEAFRDSGGKLLYLGGNGFYWVTGVVNADAPIVEIRRGHVGIRTWESEPGEVDLISSWEPGGLWRYRGRAPQRLVGVGMAAQGGKSQPYWVADGARASSMAWALAGIDGDLIGSRGFVREGAAGDEIDRVDSKLGTPPGTVVLASSKDHPLDAQRAAEELLQLFHGSASGPNDPNVHADIVLFETPAGGAVFSVGSIAFMGSLLVDEGENSSSRLLRNVVDHYLG